MAGLRAPTVLILALAAAFPAAAATKPAGLIVARTRTEISFSLADANSPVGHYAIGGVSKDGKTIRTPRRMELDARTGKFSWQPTESQAGTYDVEFLITEPPPRLSRTARRRITVQAGGVTTDRGAIGRLLGKWYADGTAAGNTGDFYDNRDRGHSRLNTARFPQLDKVEYPEQLKQRRLDWGLQVHLLFPHVTIGNSSTSSGAATGGCNSRRAVMSARAVAVLRRQYRGSNLYVYPEHRDHDPGRNGRGGYGDLFPANVPYLITSQGSSGSDRVFLEAVAYTLAAFRPDVKKRLVETGLLMPTVQMIFRACNKNANHLRDYLTGKAHPSVFEGANVDALAMVRMAHEISGDDIPPLAQLAAVEEDEARPGRDYFEPDRSEKLFDTPSAIARIARSTKHTRRMVVSAEASHDVNRRPLTYHWAVLRGDAERIEIKPLNTESSRVELLVPHHERRPIYPGAEMESSRVDIGAFVRNGKYYSAPAFVCFYWLNDEARTYDANGRIIEVGYDYADSTIGYPTDSLRDGRYDITGWKALLDLAGGKGEGFPAELLRKRLGDLARTELRRAAKELAEAAATEAAPKKAYDAGEAARKKARAAEDEAKKKLSEAGSAAGANGEALKAAQRRLKEAEAARKEADKR
ncbi:MAG: putative Ig domain-containing protein, partial [Phycisphaerae bacterium]